MTPLCAEPPKRPKVTYAQIVGPSGRPECPAHDTNGLRPAESAATRWRRFAGSGERPLLGCRRRDIPHVEQRAVGPAGRMVTRGDVQAQAGPNAHGCHDPDTGAAGRRAPAGTRTRRPGRHDPAPPVIAATTGR